MLQKSSISALFAVILFAFTLPYSVSAQDTTTTKSGLKIVITKEGKGEKPTKGDKVWVNYKGTFAKDGSVFDDSEGYPISFILGKGEVIKGWDEGIAFLTKKGKATLIIPSNLGYGEKGYPAEPGVDMIPIPPNADLVFEVELVKFKAAK